MSAKKDETTTKRIPLTPTAFDRLREFSRGLDESYSDTIEFLLSLAIKPGEDALLAGRRLRDQAAKEGK